ncbi:MAG: ribose-5-phosphate isomerase RpiA [Gammaproteobacteria bacterium]
MDQNDKKRLVALAALPYIKDGMSLGVGTGSTVNFFIDALPEHTHRFTAIVSSSEASTKRLKSLKIDVTDLNRVGDVDLYIDGADEATKNLHLIKGGGGALTREKILAGASRRFICIIDDSKLVALLGSFPVPVEVVPMAQSYVARQLVKAGGKPIWREGFTSDNGNQILDVHNLAVTNPMELETRLNQIPGVVTVGIFANRKADTLLVGQEDGVITME